MLVPGLPVPEQLDLGRVGGLPSVSACWVWCWVVCLCPPRLVCDAPAAWALSVAERQSPN